LHSRAAWSGDMLQICGNSSSYLYQCNFLALQFTSYTFFFPQFTSYFYFPPLHVLLFFSLTSPPTFLFPHFTSNYTALFVTFLQNPTISPDHLFSMISFHAPSGTLFLLLHLCSSHTSPPIPSFSSSSALIFYIHSTPSSFFLHLTLSSPPSL